MGVRDTSIQVYRDILDSGMIGDMQKIVYEGIYKFGPCTSSELYEFMSVGQNVQHSNIRARLGELRDMGAVSELKKIKCEITGRLVLTWDATLKMPVRYQKKQTKKDKIERLMIELRDFYKQSKDPWTKARIKRVVDIIKEI